ncbi:MAG TPA: hypothetical protein PKX00_13075 [Opitutaceae bacterium]|nr:hypothetical protein [Opitutaceae bacterium]
MPTLSFHAPEAESRRIRAAARQRGQPVSRFLRDAAESAAGVSLGGLGRELERLALDGLGKIALERIRQRAKDAGADKITEARVTAIVKAARRDRHG